MGAFADLRTALTADLAALGIPVHPTWPTSLDVPCAFVTPPLAGADYITAGPQFGQTYTMALDLVILTPHAPAEEAYAALELLIEAALLNTVDWELRGVAAPTPIAVTESGAEYLGTVIHLSKTTRL